LPAGRPPGRPATPRLGPGNARPVAVLFAASGQTRRDPAPARGAAGRLRGRATSRPRSQVPGPRSQVRVSQLGTWELEPETWNLEPGALDHPPDPGPLVRRQHP